MDSIREDFHRYDNFIKKYDLYIWDFDLTVVKIHTYATEVKEEDVTSLSWKKFMHHFADPIFFRDLVIYLIENKKKVAIASFGNYNVIKTYMDRLFADNHIFDKNNIITPDKNTRHLRNGTDKNQYIINLSREYNVEYNKIIFFDDTLLNTNNANDLGVLSIEINKNEGFTKRVWNSVMPIDLDTSNKEMNEKIIHPLKEKQLEKVEQKKEKEISVVEGFENKTLSFIINDRYLTLINILAIIFIIVYFYFKYR